MVAALAALVASRRPGALALLEIDGFKSLALRRGDDHVGQLLRGVAQQLEACEPGRSFRLHDGLFAVVLPSAGDLPTWAEELSIELDRTSQDITVSIGTARAERGVAAATLEERATAALRSAQRRGKGSTADFVSPEGSSPGDITSAEAQALYDVLSVGYLKVHYQPIIDLRDGRTIGFEALARPQATHGLHGPREAFDVASHLGLVPELDAVCRESIFGEGPGFELPRNVRLHVNISSSSLGHRSLSAAVLRRQLRAAGLEPRRVVFELGQDHDVDPAVTDRELRRLAEAGFGLLLDDVGTGNAGLGRLGTGRFGAVKISHQVIAAAPTSRYAAGIVQAVCAFARHTDTTVIAGGVGDAAMLDFVQQFRAAGAPDWRIPAAQGYQLGRPRASARVGTVAAVGNGDEEVVEP